MYNRRPLCCLRYLNLKTMKKRINLISLKSVLSALVIMFMITGCFDDRKILFDHQLLEWEPPNRATNALSANIKLDAGEVENHTISLRIQYAGEHVAQPITGVFEVHAPETTATEGEHFRIVGEKSLTIPPNSSVSEAVEIEIISAAINPGDSFDITLRITDDSDIPPMENYKDFVLTVSK